MAGALIGALRISLSAETTAFEAGMAKSQRTAARTAANLNKSFDSVQKTISRTALRFAEVLTLAAIYRAGKQALEYAGHLGELADTLGLTTKDLQTFSYAAGQVGISQEELQVGIQKLTVSMGQAEVGAKKQITAFKAIGISVDDLKGKNAGDVFRMIAERLEKVTDRSQRAAIEVALFGKAGAKLDNLLSGSQGRLNELSDAAERLGIVLSDEQIRKADQTADKIAALQTVLKAQIAGAVADNADAILGLANAISTLLSTIGPAIQGWRILIAEFKAGGNAIAHLENPFTAAGKAADEIRLKSKLKTLPGWDSTLGGLVKPAAAPSGGTDVGNFLGGGGKGKKDHSAQDLERKRLDAARNAYDFQVAELDAQKNILEAKKDLAADYVEQTTLSVQILNNEREHYQAQLAYDVAQNAITKGKEGISQAVADQRLAEYDIADGLKRQKLLQDEEEQRERDVADLIEHDYERRRDLLEKQADLATTQSERRKIELDLLRLAYEEKKQALERIVAESKNAKDIENARRDLVDLNANYSLDRQNVVKQTRGPLEEWAASVPKTAAEINEALQSIEAQGLDGLADAIGDVINGTRSLKDAFGDLARSIISDLIRMTVRMLIFRAISGIFGSTVPSGGTDLSGYTSLSSSYVPHFATGGSFIVGGRPGIDRNIMSINGMAVGKVGMNERVRIENDNSPRGGEVTIHQSFQFDGVAITEQQFVRGLMGTKAATIAAIRDMNRRR